MKYLTNIRQKYTKVLSYISFICLFLLIIDGLVPNFEMLIVMVGKNWTDF